MFRSSLLLLALISGALLLSSCTTARNTPDSLSAAAVVAAAHGRADLLDMTQPLDENSTFFPSLFPALATQNLPGLSGITPVNVGIRIFPGGSPFTLSPPRNGFSSHFTTGEHTGTHTDAPNHFLSLGADIADFEPADLVRPVVVIDIREQAVSEPRLAIREHHLLAWEEIHGRIPSGSVVYLLTGHAKSSGQRDLEHPGFAPDAAKFLREERDIAGVGTDTLSPDISGNLAFPVHKILLKDECLILENVMHLEQLPAQGVVTLMGPLPIDDGSGAPTRVVAISGKFEQGAYESLDLTHELNSKVPYVRGRDRLFADLDIPIVDSALPVEFKLNVLPRTHPMARETTAKPLYHSYYNGYFQMGVMAGTHVTFPRRHSVSGTDAAGYPIDRLIAPAIVLNFTDLPDDGRAEVDMVMQRLGGRDVGGKIVVLHTDTDSTGFFRERIFPGISEQAAMQLMEMGAVGIASDAPEIDSSIHVDQPAERAVHRAGGFTVASLRKPGRLPTDEAILAVLPLPIVGSEASPARVMAYTPARASRFSLRTPR